MATTWSFHASRNATSAPASAPCQRTGALTATSTANGVRTTRWTAHAAMRVPSRLTASATSNIGRAMATTGAAANSTHVEVVARRTSGSARPTTTASAPTAAATGTATSSESTTPAHMPSSSTRRTLSSVSAGLDSTVHHPEASASAAGRSAVMTTPATGTIHTATRPSTNARHVQRPNRPVLGVTSTSTSWRLWRAVRPSARWRGTGVTTASSPRRRRQTSSAAITARTSTTITTASAEPRPAWSATKERSIDSVASTCVSKLPPVATRTMS